ncbi:MAG: hypothetical protein AB7I98_19385 [Verrucomicrobiales bacterium]
MKSKNRLISGSLLVIVLGIFIAAFALIKQIKLYEEAKVSTVLRQLDCAWLQREVDKIPREDIKANSIDVYVSFPFDIQDLQDALDEVKSVISGTSTGLREPNLGVGGSGVALDTDQDGIVRIYGVLFKSQGVGIVYFKDHSAICLPIARAYSSPPEEP